MKTFRLAIFLAFAVFNLPAPIVFAQGAGKALTLGGQGTSRVYIKGNCDKPLSAAVTWSAASTTITNTTGATNWGTTGGGNFKQLIPGSLIKLGGAVRSVLSVNAGANPQTAVISATPGNSGTAATAYTDGDLILIEDQQGTAQFLIGGNQFLQARNFAIGTPHRFSDSSPPIAQSIGPSNVLASTFSGLLSGGVSVGAASTAVVGTDTRFQDELTAGDLISIYGTVREVATITDQTHLTLTANHPGSDATHDVVCYKVPATSVNVDADGNIFIRGQAHVQGGLAVGTEGVEDGLISLANENNSNHANLQSLTTTAERQALLQDDNGILALSDGTHLKFLTNTATLDFADTAAGAVTDLTITVTGAAAGDAVSIGVPNGSVPAAGSFSGWVSSSNTVTIRFANNDLTTSRNPASGTFRATVFHY